MHKAGSKKNAGTKGKTPTNRVRQARKVGGLWVDPMSFPALTEFEEP